MDGLPWYLRNSLLDLDWLLAVAEPVDQSCPDDVEAAASAGSQTHLLIKAEIYLVIIDYNAVNILTLDVVKVPAAEDIDNVFHNLIFVRLNPQQRVQARLWRNEKWSLLIHRVQNLVTRSIFCGQGEEK